MFPIVNTVELVFRTRGGVVWSYWVTIMWWYDKRGHFIRAYARRA